MVNDKPTTNYGDPIPIMRVPFGGGTIDIYICSHCRNVYADLK